MYILLTLNKNLFLTLNMSTVMANFIFFYFLFFSKSYFIYFFKFYFIFKLYKIVLVSPNIKMNPPQVYMCSPS